VKRASTGFFRNKHVVHLAQADLRMKPSAPYSGSVSKQALMRLAHGAVAFARLGFTASTVADNQMAMLLLDGACP
jgi:hypothetical protein